MFSILHNISIVKFFDALYAQNPNPRTELQYTNPFTLLIAVLFSAQATDKGVNKATESFFRVVSKPEDILTMSEETVLEAFKTINYYKTKCKNLIQTCKILVEKHQSQVPNNRSDLEALPGIGRKTANVILNCAFGVPTIAVDTHIFRVSNRTGLTKGKTPLDVEQQLLKIVPKQYLKDAHHWLVLLGRYICKARKPDCINCPVRTYCLYPDKTIFKKTK